MLRRKGFEMGKGNHVGAALETTSAGKSSIWVSSGSEKTKMKRWE